MNTLRYLRNGALSRSERLPPKGIQGHFAPDLEDIKWHGRICVQGHGYPARGLGGLQADPWTSRGIAPNWASKAHTGHHRGLSERPALARRGKASQADAGQLKELARVAHSLQGIGLSLGLNGFSSELLFLEHAASAGDRRAVTQGIRLH